VLTCVKWSLRLFGVFLYFARRVTVYFYQKRVIFFIVLIAYSQPPFKWIAVLERKKEYPSTETEIAIRDVVIVTFGLSTLQLVPSCRSP